MRFVKLGRERLTPGSSRTLRVGRLARHNSNEERIRLLNIRENGNCVMSRLFQDEKLLFLLPFFLDFKAIQVLLKLSFLWALIIQQPLATQLLFFSKPLFSFFLQALPFLNYLLKISLIDRLFKVLHFIIALEALFLIVQFFLKHLSTFFYLIHFLYRFIISFNQKTNFKSHFISLFIFQLQQSIKIND